MYYYIKLTEDDNNTYLVTSPDFPELTTFGVDKDDAVMRALDALEEVIAARISDREEVPEPHTKNTAKDVVMLPLSLQLKVLLWRTMCEQEVRKTDLARLLNLHGPQIDRLVNVHHASTIDQMEKALSALGKHLTIREVEVRAA